MSAICAVYRRDGAPVPAATATRLLEALSEYGSRASYWAPETPDAPVALGCIPWRVTPEDAGYTGPVRSAHDDMVVVADARIDNRDELTDRLDIARGDAASLCDAALILAAWRRWQHECPRMLVGEFAFVIWDRRRHELFCARDAIGQRVLFYHETARGVALATTAHALASLPEVETALDEQKVADFLVLLQNPHSSFFRGISRLAAGHTLTVDREGVRVTRYWSPRPDRMLKLGSDDDYVEAFLDVFQTAVRSQLRADGAVMMMTSGGLDSSSVAAVAAEQLRAEGRTLPTFHAAPREGLAIRPRSGFVVDESGEVEALARMHPNIELHIRRSGNASPLDRLDMCFRMTGIPPRNPSNSGWFLGIYEQASAAGARVLLSGHKGNATISQTGLRSLRDSAVRGEWVRLWRETHALARATGAGRRDVFRREVAQTLLPPAISRSLLWLRGAEPKRVWDATQSAIHPDFAVTMDVEERIRQVNRHHQDIHRLSEIEFRLMVLMGGADAYDLYSGLRPWFGIETRDPTADRRVVEFCMAVPAAQYLRNGESRSLIRRAMAGRVPDQIRLRTAYGMQGPDWIEWLPTIRSDLAAELERLERSDTARRCLDLRRLRLLLERWPDRLTLAHEANYTLLLLRGIIMGRFIRWFEESYA